MENQELQTVTDSPSASVTYVGTSEVGRASSEAKWQIKRIETSGNVTTVAFACKDGSPNSDDVFIWDDRASLKYALDKDTIPPVVTDYEGPDAQGNVEAGLSYEGHFTVSDNGGDDLSVVISTEKGSTLTIVSGATVVSGSGTSAITVTAASGSVVTYSYLCVTPIFSGDFESITASATDSHGNVTTEIVGFGLNV